MSAGGLHQIAHCHAQQHHDDKSDGYTVHYAAGLTFLCGLAGLLFLGFLLVAHSLLIVWPLGGGVVYNVGIMLLLAFGVVHEVGLDETVQLAVHHAAHVAGLIARAVVLHAAVVEHVGANL